MPPGGVESVAWGSREASHRGRRTDKVFQAEGRGGEELRAPGPQEHLPMTPGHCEQGQASEDREEVPGPWVEAS